MTSKKIKNSLHSTQLCVIPTLLYRWCFAAHPEMFPTASPRPVCSQWWILLLGLCSPKHRDAKNESCSYYPSRYWFMDSKPSSYPVLIWSPHKHKPAEFISEAVAAQLCASTASGRWGNGEQLAWWCIMVPKSTNPSTSNAVPNSVLCCTGCLLLSVSCLCSAFLLPPGSLLTRQGFVLQLHHEAAPSTWFEFRARLHMMSHFHCQPGQGQDSSSWEGLHWAFTLLPLMPSPPDWHFRFQAWCNCSHQVSLMNGEVGAVLISLGCRSTFLETGWKFLLHASCSKSQMWPCRVNEPWRLRAVSVCCLSGAHLTTPQTEVRQDSWEPLLSALPGSSTW